MDPEKVIELEEGYKIVLEQGIEPFIDMIESDSKRKTFKANQYVIIYDIVFKMCIQREPKNFRPALQTLLWCYYKLLQRDGFPEAERRQ